MARNRILVVDESEVQPAVPVNIGYRSSHSGLFAAILAICDTRFHAGVGESAVAIVALEDAGLRIDSDVYIRPVVPVVIECRDGEGITLTRSCNSRLL